MRLSAHRRCWRAGLMLASVGGLLLAACAAGAKAPPSLDLDPPEAVRLTGHAEYLADPDHKFGIADLRPPPNASTQPPPFQRLTAATLNPGLTTDAYWLRVRIPNPSERPREWTLLAEAAYLDHVDAWLFDSNGNQRTLDLSDRRPFSERVLNHRALGFEHQTPAGGYSDVYLRVAHDRLDTMHLGFRVIPEAAFPGEVAQSYFIYGLLYGAMLVLAIYALIVWRRGRDPRFGYYAAYILATAATWMSVNGHLHQFLLPQYPELVNQGMHIVFLATVVTALLFSRSFLQTAEILPRTDRLMVAAVIGLTAGIALRLLGLWTLPLLLSHAAIGLTVLLALVGVAAWRRGITYARWFVAAWVMYGGMLLLNALHVTGIVSWLHTDQLYPIAQTLNLLEIVMLAIAQADRYLVLQGERREAEQRYRKLLESHNQDLERRVGERTHELAAAWAQARADSETDEETGLGNRRFLLRAAERTLTYTSAHSYQALVYFDLDEFKEINDRHGHAAGDAVLRSFARALRAHVRDEDVTARFGGDEFILLLVNLPSVGEARHIVDRICTSFREHTTEHEHRCIGHTVSAGIALRPPASAISLRTLLARADLALYLAKDCGGDQVMVENGRPDDDSGESAQMA